MGKNRGDAVLFDKISNISTAGGSLNETATIPKNNYTITQGTLTVTEFGKNYCHLIISFLKGLFNELCMKLVIIENGVNSGELSMRQP